MVGLYKDTGLDVYEAIYYSNLEHVHEVDQVLQWYAAENTRVLDIGCSGGLHALEFAKRRHSVIGIDIEPSAIQRAKERSRAQVLNVCFQVLDIENDDIIPLGKFDLIYSIGNVISHLDKYRLYNSLRKVKLCLNSGGTFLFNVYTLQYPFREVIVAKRPRIFWKRQVDQKTGRIYMSGTFLDFGFTELFEVWGYYRYEIDDLLGVLGFRQIDCSNRLDFCCVASHSTTAPSVYFRATTLADERMI
jgi:SAM-dependent methyltransferase